jgi:hypothetical protein
MRSVLQMHTGYCRQTVVLQVPTRPLFEPISNNQKTVQGDTVVLDKYPSCKACSTYPLPQSVPKILIEHIVKNVKVQKITLSVLEIAPENTMDLQKV